MTLPYNIIKSLITSEEVTRLKKLQVGTPAFHHQDDGHQLGAILVIPYLKEWLNRRLAGTFDIHFKRYEFEAGGGGVPKHTDIDINRFTHSVLIWLEDSYESGLTWFEYNGIAIAPEHIKSGDVLLFPHNIIHWADPITNGKKIVIKGDWYP